MQRYGTESYRDMPWGNRRGMTREIARRGIGGRTLWRLSIAEVTEDGPFSILPGFQRALVCIGGRGLRLEGPGGSHDARPWVPVTFPGHEPIEARLVAGPVHALNLMYDARRLDARVATVAGPATVRGAAAGTLVYVAPDGVPVGDLGCGDACLVEAGEVLDLPAGEHTVVIDLLPVEDRRALRAEAGAEVPRGSPQARREPQASE